MTMWQGMVRAGLALWFIGMLGLAVWNQQPVAQAQGGGAQTLYIPLIHNDRRAYEAALHDYIGLVRVREGSDVDFYTVRGDSTDWTLLGADASYDGAWSPDGAYFAYNKEEQGGLWLVSLATRQEQLLTAAFGRYVSWSSDSRRIAFTNDQEILVYNVQTGRVDLTVPLPTFQYPYLYWSPDGQYLAWSYAQGTNEDTHVWIWTAGAPTPRLVAVNDAYTVEHPMRWSPDSRHLLFTFRNSTALFLAEADADTSMRLPYDGYTPVVWMPNSRELLLESAATPGLYLADLTEAPPTLLTARDITPRVTPNGDGFYYVTDNNRDPNYFYDMTTRQSVALATVCDITTVQWLRDGDELRCDDRALGNGTTYGRRYQTTVADFSALPSTVTAALDSHSLAPLLPPRTDILATTHAPLRQGPRGYPIPIYEGSYLYQVPLKQLRRIAYPGSRTHPVIEWRYMP